MELNDIIIRIRNTYFGDKLEHNYANSIAISGWLITRPTIKVCDNGRRIAIFILYQINKTGYKLYMCKTYSERIITALEKQENVCLINCLGLLSLTPTTHYNLQIEEAQINLVYSKYQLVDYEKKK